MAGPYEGSVPRVKISRFELMGHAPLTHISNNSNNNIFALYLFSLALPSPPTRFAAGGAKPSAAAGPRPTMTTTTTTTTRLSFPALGGPPPPYPTRARARASTPSLSGQLPPSSPQTRDRGDYSPCRPPSSLLRRRRRVSLPLRLPAPSLTSTVRWPSLPSWQPLPCLALPAHAVSPGSPPSLRQTRAGGAFLFFLYWFVRLLYSQFPTDIVSSLPLPPCRRLPWPHPPPPPPPTREDTPHRRSQRARS